MTIFLPGVFRSPMNDSQHWTKHRRWVKDEKHRTEMAILAKVGRRHGFKASAPKLVVFCLYAAKEWDDDNLRAACKPHRDALKSMGIIDDDKPSAGHLFDYHQITNGKRGSKRGLLIAVVLYELAALAPTGPTTGGAGEEA